MRLHEFVVDEDGVSPVVGVVLMVAITVVLAAVIGAFVVGVEETDVAPQTTWESAEDADAGFVNFTHVSGDRVDADELSVSGDPTVSIHDDTPDSVDAGDAVVVQVAGSPDVGNQIFLVWSPAGSEETTILADHEIFDDW